MKEPAFLTIEDIEELHRVAIAKFGGSEGMGDHGSLESAVAQAEQFYCYGDGDIFEIASCYAFHIGENQPFMDGNKRTAVAATIAFLRCNGENTDFNSLPLYEAMIAIAEKRLSRSEFAAKLRQLSQ